jgi:hypothetical protein
VSLCVDMTAYPLSEFCVCVCACVSVCDCLCVCVCVSVCLRLRLRLCLSCVLLSLSLSLPLCLCLTVTLTSAHKIEQDGRPSLEVDHPCGDFPGSLFLCLHDRLRLRVQAWRPGHHGPLKQDGRTQHPAVRIFLVPRTFPPCFILTWRKGLFVAEVR